MQIVIAEQERLSAVYDAIERMSVDRAKTLAAHDAHTVELERERLESVSWKEKNDLALKLVEHGHFDPRKYLVEFKQIDSPYFGVVGIHDKDRQIGSREYLIGKQMLMDGNKVLVVDWRKAAVSRLFYDYEEGEEYEETIQGRDREGVITRKVKIGIDKRVLHRIETATDIYELAGDGWRRNGDAGSASTADTKEQQQDHHMVDIVSLISAEQFRMITKETEGCTYLTGGAGSGKTTVALHRLSYLQFNFPEKFRAERSLVLMFNRTLRDYVKSTSMELLGKTRVETYNSWVMGALAALGVQGVKMELEDKFGSQKKNSAIPALLAHYVAGTGRIVPSVLDLWRFYARPYVASALFDNPREAEEFTAVAQVKYAAKDRNASFADLSVLLRLCQLRRSTDAVVEGALNWYDHVIVDEAQDFCQVDLETILAATSSCRSMTVCADEKQKILSFIDSSGFANFKNRLHAMGLDRETLSVSYRSAREIMELASRVSGRPVDTLRSHSGIVKYHETTSFDSAASRLRGVIEEISVSAPNSLTAVICKKKADVKKVHAALKGVKGLHREGEVAFTPGVLVVNAHQVKGVEFSNVVLWNPDERDYRQTETDINLLYVAITRACKRLDIVYWGALPACLRPDGLLCGSNPVVASS